MTAPEVAMLQNIAISLATSSIVNVCTILIYTRRIDKQNTIYVGKIADMIVESSRDDSGNYKLYKAVDKKGNFSGVGCIGSTKAQISVTAQTAGQVTYADGSID